LNFTVEYLEYILLVFIRVASVVFVAPFFGSSEIPRRVKVAIAFFLSLTVMNQVDYKAVEYANILEYSGLVLKEAITGIIIGLGSRLCLYIFNFSGKCELDLPGLTESAELTPDAFIFCDSNNSLTIRALHKLDILLALVNEDCLLTHTTYWNSQFEEQVFTKKNPSHKLFASILNTTFKFLHTLPLEEHELVIDGIFSFLRPVFNEQRLLTQVQLTHPLEVLKQRADRIIEVRFKEKNLRLTDIAQELGVSVRYLSEAYKHAGTTALKALMQHRLQRANVMLREGHCRELSIREISSITGFACLSHFSRAFKEEYGLTPTEARTEEILV